MIDLITKVLRAIKEKEPWAIHTSLLFLLCAILWSPVGSYLLPKGLIQVPLLPLVRITITAILIMISLCSYLLYLHFSNRRFKDYKFSQRAGSYIHKNKIDRICAKCKINNDFSPLTLDQEKNLFICPNCGNESLNYPHILHLNNGAVLIREQK